MSGTSIIYPSGTPISNAVISPASHLFVGFSTVTTSQTKNTKLYDIDLVNRDLYYAFNTRVGERVMRPEWGCKIWDYFMEPLTATLREQIVQEATRICESDTRLEVQNVSVFQLDNGVRVENTLYYRPYNVINTFTTDFVNRQTTYFNGPSTS